MNKALIEVRHLTKTFKKVQEKGVSGIIKPALNDISLSLKCGEMAALVGPDGAGKTTFLRVLCGLMVPDNNDFNAVRIGEYYPAKDLKANLAGAKRLIGYMPQKFGLYEDLTVLENLKLYSVLNRGDKDTASIDTLLEFAGLKEFKSRLAGNLSGGMKQKLGLCCTLISKPALLLLDEPSVGVDPISRRELMKIVEKLVKDNNIAVIWSTSYLDEAENFEKVFIFSEGQKIYDGSPKSEEILSAGGFEDFVVRKMLKNRGNADDKVLLKRIIEPVSDDKMPKDGVTIRAKGLTKDYGTFRAADNISFEIKKGEIFGLLGPNGAGKSTTFKMLCGLIRPNSGCCSIMGVRLDENPTLARGYLGYMAQKFSLFGNLSVKQNLSFFAGVYGLFGFEKSKKINALLNFYDLKKYENTNAEALPLGYKQRLALSCATVHSPYVLFLDEPTSGVDPVSRREFWEQIRALSKSGVTVLVTTHFMDEAQFCDRISLIYRSKSLVTGTPDELKNLVKTEQNPNPTMEDAFIELISRNTVKYPGGEK